MGCCLCSGKPRVWGRWPTFVENGGTSEFFLLGPQEVLERRCEDLVAGELVASPGGLDDRRMVMGHEGGRGVGGQERTQSEDLMHRRG